MSCMTYVYTYVYVYKLYLRGAVVQIMWFWCHVGCILTLTILTGVQLFSHHGDSRLHPHIPTLVRFVQCVLVFTAFWFSFIYQISWSIKSAPTMHISQLGNRDEPLIHDCILVESGNEDQWWNRDLPRVQLYLLCEQEEVHTTLCVVKTDYLFGLGGFKSHQNDGFSDPGWPTSHVSRFKVTTGTIHDRKDQWTYVVVVLSAVKSAY